MLGFLMAIVLVLLCAFFPHLTMDLAGL